MHMYVFMCTHTHKYSVWSWRPTEPDPPLSMLFCSTFGAGRDYKTVCLLIHGDEGSDSGQSKSALRICVEAERKGRGRGEGEKKTEAEEDHSQTVMCVCFVKNRRVGIGIDSNCAALSDASVFCVSLFCFLSIDINNTCTAMPHMHTRT